MKKKKWQKYYDYKLKNKEKPRFCLAIIKISKDLFVCVHTDIEVYDYKNKKAWKGDLV